MTKECIAKVMKAGFTIMRKDDTPSIRIKYKSSGLHEWRTYEHGFKSKAERDRRFQQLLNQNDFFIEN